MLCVCICVCICGCDIISLLNCQEETACSWLVGVLLLPVRKVYGLAVNITCGVYKRFWKGRVGMYRIRYILGFHVHSNCKSSFSDHLACMWCDDQSSYNYSVFLKNLKDSPCVA